METEFLTRRVGRLLAARRRWQLEPALAGLERLPRAPVEAALFAALADENARAGASAAWALCRLDPQRQVEPIVSELRARRNASGAAAPYRPPDAGELIALRLAWCECEGLRRPEAFSRALADRDRGTDGQVRAMAAFMLGYVDKPEVAIPALTAAVDDPEPAVRFAVRRALVRARRRARRTRRRRTRG